MEVVSTCKTFKYIVKQGHVNKQHLTMIISVVGDNIHQDDIFCQR